mmetsp:Transcript_16741/g.40356  ORF Transcript_16741/g.40356 Transcript_16741/m.40356 type:complete len:334 (-) Transcript_16741:81-1082(-)
MPPAERFVETVLDLLQLPLVCHLNHLVDEPRRESVAGASRIDDRDLERWEAPAQILERVRTPLRPGRDEHPDRPGQVVEDLLRVVQALFTVHAEEELGLLVGHLDEARAVDVLEDIAAGVAVRHTDRCLGHPGLVPERGPPVHVHDRHHLVDVGHLLRSEERSLGCRVCQPQRPGDEVVDSIEEGPVKLLQIEHCIREGVRLGREASEGSIARVRSRHEHAPCRPAHNHLDRLGRELRVAQGAEEQATVRVVRHAPSERRGRAQLRQRRRHVRRSTTRAGIPAVVGIPHLHRGIQPERVHQNLAHGEHHRSPHRVRVRVAPHQGVDEHVSRVH